MSNGYLAGGYFQWYFDVESKGTSELEKQWGLVTDTLGFLGQGRFPEVGGRQVRVSYSWLYLTDQPAVAGVLKIVGGYQLFSTEVFAWGNRGSLFSDQEVYISE